MKPEEFTLNLRAAAEKLQRAGIDTPALDARLLLQHAGGFTHEEILAGGEMPCPDGVREAFAALVARRAVREPMAQILGFREFYGRNFRVNRQVLTPRPDTETLIDAVLARIPREWGGRILDLGTGSGCLLLTLLSELPQAQGTGVDISGQALEVARENSDSLGLAGRAVFRQGDLFAALGADEKNEQKYEIIVANPPYIPSNALASLMPEVVDHEPHLALDGGTDGLDYYRRIAAQSLHYLCEEPGAAHPPMIVLEVGEGQMRAVSDLFVQAGLRVEAQIPDLAGIPRCLVASRMG